VRVPVRDVIATAVIALIVGTAVVLPPFDYLRGLSLDILTTLRWRAFGSMQDPATSPVVVVAFDEESYRRPPFRGTPSIAWTRELGRILTAIIDGGAKVVGFDVVYPVSIEQSELPFGDETLGSRLRGASLVNTAKAGQQSSPQITALSNGGSLRSSKFTLEVDHLRAWQPSARKRGPLRSISQ
jgi:CHASE2 domain-containing sensor protein